MAFKPALLVIDMQNDFCVPSHGLNPVSGNGMDLVAPIKELLSLPGFAMRATSKCEIPHSHKIFAHNNEGATPLETHIDFPNTKKGKGHETVKHPTLRKGTIQGTWGADLVDGLSEHDFDFVIRRNKRPDVWQFSALKDMHGNDKHDLHPDAISHHLGDELTSRNITDVFLVGTAGDYCVSHTAMDVADAGFKTYVIEDVTMSFDHGQAWPAMKEKLQAKNVELVMKDGLEVGRVRAMGGGKKGSEKQGTQPTMVFNGNFTGPVFFGYSAEQAKGLATAYARDTFSQVTKSKTPQEGFKIVYLSLYGLSRGFRNIYSHPLSDFPGPKLAGATKMPIAVALRNGSLSQWLLRLHDEYSSDIVRISPDELSIIGPSAWKDIYAHHQGRPSFPKDLGIYTGVKNIVTANDADHSRMRRLLSHAFSDKALKEQESILQTHVDELVHGLMNVIEGPEQGKTDLVNWYQWIAVDNVCDLAFGESFHCLTTSHFHPWVANLISALKFVTLSSVIIRFPPLKKLLGMVLMTENARKAREAHKQVAAEKLEKRVNSESARPDFMSHIMAHNDTKSGMTQEEIVAAAETFISAGGEATGGSLCGFTWYVLRNRDCLQKLQQEVRQACKTRHDVTLQNIEQLEYLQAVMDEGFRMYPTALAGQPRRVPAEGATICGRYVPGGTGIQLNQYAAFNSSRNFSEPSKFAPDRWLEGDGNRYASDKKDVLQPFSIGARNCIGKNLALAEIRLVLARMLWEFDMELCDETDVNWPDQPAWMTWQQKPLYVTLTARVN